MPIRYQINNSPKVIEQQVREIMSGDLADPTESTLGSRIEAVARLDAMYAEQGPRRPKADNLAAMLGVTKRTIERYRHKIRMYTLG